MTADTQRGPAVQDRQWMLTLLPASPLLLLLLRIWYLSRQNLQTMLLLVQDVSTLGLISALVITLTWTFPLIVLVARLLGTLYQVSTTGTGVRAGSVLIRVGLRIPYWVVVLSVLLAAFTWQLRFLPTLLMMGLMMIGLGVRQHGPHRPRLIRATCVALPVIAAVAAYAVLGPAIVTAIREGETVTALLLLLPPALTVLLTGPIPARAARPFSNSVTVLAVLLGAFLIGTIFLRTPILPTIAVETDTQSQDSTPPDVIIGYVIAVNDRMTTVLDKGGSVRFIPNERVISETLCSDSGPIPSVPVSVYGWQVEETTLTWMAPSHQGSVTDPRCHGRPLETEH